MTMPPIPPGADGLANWLRLAEALFPDATPQTSAERCRLEETYLRKAVPLVWAAAGAGLYAVVKR